MANTKSALKKIRQDEKRRMRNKHYKTMMKNAIKKVLNTIMTSKKRDEIDASLRQAVSIIHRVQRKGIIKRNTASRKISRLYKKVNSIYEKIAQK